MSLTYEELKHEISVAPKTYAGALLLHAATVCEQKKFFANRKSMLFAVASAYDGCASLAPEAAVLVAAIYYDPEAPENQEMSVKTTELARGFLATLGDFELKIFATEAGLRVRKALELPPSPKPKT